MQPCANHRHAAGLLVRLSPLGHAGLKCDYRGSGVEVDGRVESGGAAENAHDAMADARLPSADSGEVTVGRWEEPLGAPAGGSGTGPETPDVAVVHPDETVGTVEAVAQRPADSRHTLLALAFVKIAEHFDAAEDFEEVLSRITEAALVIVPGAEAASVTVLHGNGYRTVGPTGESASLVDQAQYDVDEGPCLDAARISRVVAVPSFPDERWALLGAAPVRHGVGSSVSYQLTVGGNGTAFGSLNIYAHTVNAFDPAAVEIGLILAVHASLAARTVRERIRLPLPEHLEQALLSRDVIGQAKGILMERLHTTPGDAFQILKYSSQHSNVKLREVARSLSETGEIPSASAPQPSRGRVEARQRRPADDIPERGSTKASPELPE